MFPLTIALSVLASFASPSAQPCSPLDPGFVHTQIEAALRAPDDSSQNEALAILGEYWKKVCKDARVRASKPVVVELTRLLPIPAARSNTASMLVEIGPNLIYARPAVATALVDQQRLDRKWLHDAAPYVPNGYQVASSALACVAHKIRTGAIDKRKCRYVMLLNEG